MGVIHTFKIMLCIKMKWDGFWSIEIVRKLWEGRVEDLIMAIAVSALFLLVSCSHNWLAPLNQPAAPQALQKGGSSVVLPLADVHFHVRNYVQGGLTLAEAHDVLSSGGVRRAAVFGIPLQQRWDMETGVAPSYYLHDDQELYYYSAVDAIVAAEFQGLPEAKRALFDPMIVGFNPTDGRAVDHIRNMLLKFPGTFSGIGEFSIKKEVVSGKIAGSAANIEDPALGRVLDFAAESGLVVILHCDVDAMISGNAAAPTYLKALSALFRRHPETTIIWAHGGLGRYVKARPGYADVLGRLFLSHSNLFVDISWDVVAADFFDTSGVLKPEWKKLFIGHPKRVLFGSDAVAPSAAGYSKTLALYQKLWDVLPKNVVSDITLRNYLRLFDRARTRIRRWEAGAR